MSFGQRLLWVRKTLKLERSFVSKEVGIPRSQIKYRELGKGTFETEQFFKLASFYNGLWQELKSNPLLNGVPVKEISAEWLVTGHGKIDTVKSVAIKQLQEMIREKNEVIDKLEMENVILKMSIK